MSSIDKDINGLLNTMHTQETKAKGSTGELAVTRICEEFYNTMGGILYHSYSYKTDAEQAGNIKKDGGKLYVENLGSFTEIDVLYVSPFKVFPIEVKSYKAKEIVLTDDGISGCAITDKSPVHQNEMHCRHLYAHIFKCLPDGETQYIIPIVCMVDEATIRDKRSPWQKKYIKVCILNTLKDTISKNNNPGGYRLDLQAIDRTLKEVSTDYDKYYPLRI